MPASHSNSVSSAEEAHASLWFFIGLLLDVYGVLIFGASIYDLYSPPAHPPVLANLHAGIWWGALLIILGVVYTIAFSPSRRAARSANHGSRA